MKFFEHTWKDEKQEILEGTYLGARQVRTKANSERKIQIVVQTDKKDYRIAIATPLLINKIMEYGIKKGHHIKIQFLGMVKRKTDKGEYADFSVESNDINLLDTFNDLDDVELNNDENEATEQNEETKEEF